MCDGNARWRWPWRTGIRGTRGLGYHFSAVLPRKHVPGINELTISEQLLPHRERPRRPFSTDLWWWVRPKHRSDVREKAKRRGTSPSYLSPRDKSRILLRYRAMSIGCMYVELFRSFRILPIGRDARRNRRV